jgi:hypothetical protein
MRMPKSELEDHEAWLCHCRSQICHGITQLLEVCGTVGPLDIADMVKPAERRVGYIYQ